MQIQVMSWTRAPKQDLAKEPEGVRAAVLRYLSRREYTAAELRQRLKDRGAVSADIEAALNYVQERGYQNDARAGESHIRQRLQYAPRGRALVSQELKERGLSFELNAALLDEYYPVKTELELLQRLLAKEARLEQERLEQASPEPAPLEEGPPQFADAQKTRRLRQKMARRLLAKGFSQSLVMEALNEWLPQNYDEGFMD